MHKLASIRPGESVFGLENRLTGWADVGLNTPNGIPLVYERNDDLLPVRPYYLGDTDVAAKAA